MAKMNLGQFVRSARSAKGLTRDELADLLGTSVSTVARIELKNHVPSARTVARLASLLELPMERLVDPSSTDSAESVALAQRTGATA